MSIIFLFIDGVGIGEPSDKNPFRDLELRGFERLCGGKLVSTTKRIVGSNQIFHPIDANMDVEGLPQSGTGQASLFCGYNASKNIGKHFGPYPHSKTKDKIQNESIFNGLIKSGKKPFFINAYPEPFFVMAEKRNRWSTCSLMAKGAGQELNSLEDIKAERAITAEIKQDYWKTKLDLDIPEITEENAANRLIKAANKYDLVLFEYYLTDKAGHSRSIKNANEALIKYDNFLKALILGKSENHTIILTSDHGNVEDLSIKTHTRNPVPLCVFGKKASYFKNVKSIIEVKDAILQSLNA